MPADMFLKLDDIKGESVDEKHAGEIEVLSFSWGMTQSGTTHSGTGGGAAKVNVQDIAITKYIDASTPNFIKYCSTGKHFKEALLTVRKAGDKPVEYLKCTFKDLIVSSVSTGGSGGGERITETISLNFAEFKLAYHTQKSDGSLNPAIEAAYNIAQNKSA